MTATYTVRTADAIAARTKNVRFDLEQIEETVQMAHIVGVHACLARIEKVEQRSEIRGLHVRKVNGGDDIDDGNLLEQVADSYM